MTKMTEAQRKAIIDAHERHLGGVDHSYVRAAYTTLAVLRREGWVWSAFIAFDRPTPAGLRAAGIDLDVLHAEALELDAQMSVGRALIEQAAQQLDVDIDAPEERPYQPGHPLADREPAEPAVPALGEGVRFKHGGRVVGGTVRSTITGGREGAQVIVYSPDLGHTHRIDHGVTVPVAELLPELVVIEAHVEQMTECTDRMEVSRAEWDAMTPAQRRDMIDTFGADTMNNQGGYGASIVSGAPESDLDDPPTTTPAEARTGMSDRVAAALQELAVLRDVIKIRRRESALFQLERVEQLLRGEVGR